MPDINYTLGLLSPCELRCVALASTGLTNGDIAEKLGYKSRSVNSFLYRAQIVLGFHNRATLAYWVWTDQQASKKVRETLEAMR